MSAIPVSVRVSQVIDPAEYLLHEVRKLRSDLHDEVRIAETFRRAQWLTEQIRDLRDEFEALQALASAKADAISTAK